MLPVPLEARRCRALGRYFTTAAGRWQLPSLHASTASRRGCELVLGTSHQKHGARTLRVTNQAKMLPQYRKGEAAVPCWCSRLSPCLMTCHLPTEQSAEAQEAICPVNPLLGRIYVSLRKGFDSLLRRITRFGELDIEQAKHLTENASEIRMRRLQGALVVRRLFTFGVDERSRSYTR